MQLESASTFINTIFVMDFSENCTLYTLYPVDTRNNKTTVFKIVYSYSNILKLHKLIT